MPLSAMSYPAEVLRVIDGDTFEARVRIWPGHDVTTRVRLRGIDAPEMRARCREEETMALAARDALAAILAQGGVGVSKVGPDKYGGRVVAAASTRKTADVSGALLAAGVARSYNGEPPRWLVCFKRARLRANQRYRVTTTEVPTPTR